MGIDEDLNELEKTLRKLIFEYNQFVIGIEKKPPYELENRVTWLIRHYLSRKMGRVEHKHRFQNLVQSYRTHKHMWERRLGYREKGLDHLGRTVPETEEELAAAAQEIKSQTADAGPEKSSKPTTPKQGIIFKTTFRDPSKENNYLNDMYKNYINAQKDSGSNNKSVSKEKFSKLIEQQVSQIKKKTKCDAVSFRIEVQDGKVKLKASALKQKKKK